MHVGWVAIGVVFVCKFEGVWRDSLFDLVPAAGSAIGVGHVVVAGISCGLAIHQRNSAVRPPARGDLPFQVGGVIFRLGSYRVGDEL